MKLYKKFVSSLMSLAFVLSNVIPAALFISPLILVPAPAHALLRTNPTWPDINPVGVLPDWHYRVPITIASGASVNSTVKLDVTFTTLLTTLGINGTFDVNSPRIVRSNGTLSTYQEYTPNIFAGATNSTAGRGEIRFIAEDAGPATYYLYFDITQNGVKPENTQTAIDGNFERGSTGEAQPEGWNAPTKVGNYDAQIRPSENPSITTDGNEVGNGASPKNVAGAPNTGAFSYLLGARTSNEANSQFPSSTITKTITVPATNPGNLVFRYRIQGWDSNENGNTTQYDFFGMQIVGSTTTNVVGPALNNYTTYPFSPNYGTSTAGATNSGYGQYNGFDYSTLNVHRTQDGNAAMTLARGAEPWFTVTRSLASYAGQTITLRFSMSNTILYKSWVHIDDVEWSVVAGTLGTPQAFGVAILMPEASSVIPVGSVVSIRAQVDAAPKTYLTANIINPSGTTVASNIRLYNDGTHGSSASTPHLWYNDGSDTANPTYTIPLTSAPNTNWTLRVFALDGSTTTISGTSNGAVHIPSAANPQIEANYFNIDEIIFQVRGTPVFTVQKSVSILKDPINNTTNPKNIPGADLLYDVLITNTGSGSPDTNTVVLIDQIPLNTKLYVKDLGAAGSGPIRFTNGANSSGLTYNFAGFGAANTNVSFSNNNGVSYVYLPVADTNGYDTAITHVKISPQGIMNNNTTNNPNFTLSFQVGVK